MRLLESCSRGRRPSRRPVETLLPRGFTRLSIGLGALAFAVAVSAASAEEAGPGGGPGIAPMGGARGTRTAPVPPLAPPPGYTPPPAPVYGPAPSPQPRSLPPPPAYSAPPPAYATPPAPVYAPSTTAVPPAAASTAAPAAATTSATAASQFVPDEEAPLAGYTNNTTFIRSRDNNFLLIPSARVNVDAFFYLNRGEPPAGITPDGVEDQRPRDTILLRRARLELMGTVFKHFDYYLSGEFASTPILAQAATISDAFINVNYTPWANIQIGQFDAPFTMENRTADKYTDFMERSITVRSFGIPTNKEVGLMVHGLAPRRFLRYEVGVFNGDGGNVRNPDSHFDVMGRAYFAPLAFLQKANTTRWLNEIWFGGSFWWGKRVDVPYDEYGLSTQGGVNILAPLFGSTNRQVPNGDMFKWALELNIPIGPLGWRFEMVRVEHQGIGIYRPVDATKPEEKNLPLSRIQSGQVTRSGTSFYVQMWYWILGSPTMLPTPGQEIPTRWVGYRKGKESRPIGLYVSARYERMTLNQQDVSEAPLALTDPQKAILGNITVDSFAAALNLWVTRHVRFSANYLVNFLDGDMPVIQGSTHIPTGGPLMQPTFPYYRIAEHELLFRAAFSL